MKPIGKIAALLSAAFIGFTAVSAESKLPTRAANNDDYTIRYDDWDIVLASSVFDMGLSDRRPASRTLTRNTGTRIVHGNTGQSAYEGNRVHFSVFTGENEQALLAIRRDLEAVADFVPLENFSKNEQLAYWLNLHNVAVMYEVAKAYPIKKIKRLAGGKKGVWDEQSMTIAGVPVSIREIEQHVVTNWNDPLVLYGLFMGTIGGPNIRTTAFTGKTVRKDLQANADEFVNSLRGFKLWSGRGRVSDHYKLGKHYFPDFDEDIKKHLLQFARNDTYADLQGVSRFQMKNYNWGIADLKNGDVYTGSSYYNNPGALTHFVQTQPNQSGDSAGTPPLSSVVFNSFLNDPAFNQGTTGSISPQTRALLRAVSIRNDRRTRKGTVTVEEFTTGETSRIQKR